MTLDSSRASPQRRGLRPRTPGSMPRCVRNSPSSVASRRRIVEAGDEERRRLELRLREGAVRRLEALAASLTALGRGRPDERRRHRAGAAPAPARSVDLHELALGLHPRELVEGGPRGRAQELWPPGARCPSTSTFRRGGCAQAAEAAAYFLCSEALTNVAKYASASRVTIRIAAADGLLAVDGRRRRRRRCRSCSRLGLARAQRTGSRRSAGPCASRADAGGGTRLRSGRSRVTDDGRIRP